MYVKMTLKQQQQKSMNKDPASVAKMSLGSLGFTISCKKCDAIMMSFSTH